MNTITNSDDLIDTRAVNARIAELEAERDALQQDVDDAEETIEAHKGMFVDEDELSDDETAARKAEAALEEWEEENGEELSALQSFAEEFGSMEGTLIREDYFETYARDYAEEIGAISEGWPSHCVDWKQAADELQTDFTGADFDGVTYYIL